MNNRQNVNENSNYTYGYAQYPVYAQQTARRGGSFLSTVAVIMVIVCAIGYFVSNMGGSRNSEPQIIYQTVPSSSYSQSAPAPESTADNTQAQTQTETSRPTAGTKKTSECLEDLETIPKGEFGKMFKMEGDVEDYKGNIHRISERPTYVVYGDGFGGWFNRKVTFQNPKHYRYLTGKITVAGEKDGFSTLDDLELGYIKLVVLDSKGNPLKGGVELNKTTKEAEFWLDIGGADEFTIACDCTDGRAGGYWMRMIVEDLILTN